MDELSHDDDRDLDFDERLRQRLATPGRPHGAGSDGSEQVLGGLRPRLVRARRVRRAQVAATIVGPAVLLVGGLVALGNLTTSGDGETTVAGQPDAATTSPDDAADRATIEVTPTEPGRSPDGDQDVDAEGTASSTTAPTSEPTGSTDGTGTTGGSTATTTSPPSTSAPSTSGREPSTSVPGSVPVESSCGSIVVVVVQSSVELVETRPDAGYRVDVKSEGPEVEVSFEGPSGHCELNAEYERGQLVTSVDDEP